MAKKKAKKHGGRGTTATTNSIFAANLIANLFEFGVTAIGQKRHAGTGRVIRQHGKRNSLSLVGFETGLATWLEQSSLPHPIKTLLREIIDTVLDEYRGMSDEASENDIRKALERGGESARDILKGLTKPKEEKKYLYPKFESELTNPQREELLQRVAWLRSNADEWYQVWVDIKGRIDSKDRLAFALSLAVEDDDELPPPPRNWEDDKKQKWYRCVKFVLYLHESLITKPTPLQTLVEAVNGGGNVWTRKLENQLGQGRLGMDDSAFVDANACDVLDELYG